MTIALILALVACGDKSDTGATDTGATPEPTTNSTTDTGDTEDTEDTEDTAPFVPDHPYDQVGPYDVGTFTSTTTGSTGQTLTVQVWYPAAETGTEVIYDGLWAGGAYEDVDADCAAPYPVLMFSHGDGGIRWQSREILETVASHGYVIAAPDHVANTFFDYDPTRYDEIIVRRPVDIADTYDWLAAQADDPSSTLSGCIDGSAGYAIAGHSFGGYTAYATAGATINDPQTGAPSTIGDSRAWAAIPMAPWDVYGTLTDGNEDITVPVMCLSGTLDATTPWSMVDALYDPLVVEPRYLGEFFRAGHFSFSPVACALGETSDGCGPDDIDLEVFSTMVAASTLAFLESILIDPQAITYRAEDPKELAWTSAP